MSNMTTNEYRVGDRVWRWWDAGYKHDPQPLIVVRVNRLTLTVRTDLGNTFRLPYHEVEGLWTNGD